MAGPGLLLLPGELEQFGVHRSDGRLCGSGRQRQFGGGRRSGAAEHVRGSVCVVERAAVPAGWCAEGRSKDAGSVRQIECSVSCFSVDL